MRFPLGVSGRRERAEVSFPRAAPGRFPNALFVQFLRSTSGGRGSMSGRALRSSNDSSSCLQVRLVWLILRKYAGPMPPRALPVSGATHRRGTPAMVCLSK